MKKILFILSLIFSLNVNAQLIINDAAIINMKNGGCIILNPVVADAYKAIKLSGTQTGYIKCEEEINKVVWWLRDGANTNNITVPFGNSIGTVKIKLVNITQGSNDGAIIFATAPTTNNNKLISTGVYPTSVTSMNYCNPACSDNSINAVDRFWFVQYYNYTTKPKANDGFSFYYTDVDLGAIIESNLQAQYWNGTTWVLQPTGIEWTLNNECATITDPNISAPWVLVNKLSPLPIELTSFDVICNGSNRQGNFTTMSESNVSHFIVQSSEDMMFWNDVKTIIAVGNSNMQNYYSWNDNEYYSSSMSYYRLVEYDNDGIIIYHDAKSLICNTLSNVEIYPNPSVEGEYLSIKGKYESIKIYDIIGKEINCLIDNNKIYGLSSGIYFIIIDELSKIKVIVK